MSNKYFHFTLGPVQSFVSQARRTRDFWAGSFLLSWLSAVAIKAVEVQKGKVMFPLPDEEYLLWLTTGKGEELLSKPPKQGCIPNRFKGLVAEVPKNFNPQQVVDSVQKAWQVLAEEVWNYDLQDLEKRPKKNHTIWDRQVKSFWEISWVLADNETDSNLLDRRKNWRNYLPPDEPGVKCMMMDGWQELSGLSSPVKPDESKLSKEELAELDKEYKFWTNVRNKKGDTKLKTDLRPDEKLCAIAFIKRRFARVFINIQGVDMGGWKLYGWDVNPSVPSVSYMAAAPWLAKVLESAPEIELHNFHDAAQKLTKNYYGEYDTRLDCIDKALFKRKDLEVFWDVKSLDGSIFIESALDNKNLFEDQEQAQKVKAALEALRKSIKEKNIEPVSPFYAVLMMDGDSLGEQMGDASKQKAISLALNAFTHDVPKIVEKHSGFLIYAGGDDVLALLPLEFALQCAYNLRQLYMNSFKAHGKGKVTSTLSGAIEYAHIKMPLGKVLGDVHHLLDEVAKDGCGRDAIAVRVWKPGGQHLQWAMPWKKTIHNHDFLSTDKAMLTHFEKHDISKEKLELIFEYLNRLDINKVADDFRQTESETPFSTSFFFNIEERFAMLQSKNEKGEWEFAGNFSKKDIIQLIAAEYLTSGVNVNPESKITLAEAIEKITPLVEQCMPKKRDVKKVNTEKEFEELEQLNTDALHFIRFLVTKGVENA